MEIKATIVLVLAVVDLVVFVFLYGLSVFSTQEPFRTGSFLHLSGPTKCFSCEASLPPEYAWMGRQTKCFDCEKQLARQDPYLANMTHGTKCFSCERPVAIRDVSSCNNCNNKNCNCNNTNCNCNNTSNAALQQQQSSPPPEEEEYPELPPQAVHHRSTSMRPFYNTNVAQMCMDAGSGQCLF